MKGWCAILCLGLLCVSATSGLEPANTLLPVNDTFIVDDAGDAADADLTDGACATNTGVCTLRAAIEQANARDNATDSMDVISFDILGDGPHRIQPTSPLPSIRVPVFIDGTTQPGFDGATNTLSIELDGSLAGDQASGLTIIAGNSVIQGLMINNFRVYGVFINNAHNNAVGTSDVGNIISGNVFDGILVSGTSTMNEILNNDISANLLNGILVSTTRNGVAIPDEGLANTIQDNSISANLLNGILVSGISTKSEILNNDISANLLNGILVSGISTKSEILDNDISANLFNGILVSGTPTKNEILNNDISANLFDGILVSGTSTMNEIRGNSIFSNTGLGIDLGNDGVTPNDIADADTGANHLQNAPEISSAVTAAQNTTIIGNLNSTAGKTFTLEFFANTDCHTSGSGEGKAFLGSLAIETDVLGNASFNFVSLVPQEPGVFITATATDPDGNTSEFSKCVMTE